MSKVYHISTFNRSGLTAKLVLEDSPGEKTILTPKSENIEGLVTFLADQIKLAEERGYRRKTESDWRNEEKQCQPK